MIAVEMGAVWTERTKEELETLDKAKILYKKCRKLDKKSGKGVLKFAECKFLKEAYERYSDEHPELYRSYASFKNLHSANFKTPLPDFLSSLRHFL